MQGLAEQTRKRRMNAEDGYYAPGRDTEEKVLQWKCEDIQVAASNY